jgi:hypothetical protein
MGIIEIYGRIKIKSREFIELIKRLIDKRKRIFRLDSGSE